MSDHLPKEGMPFWWPDCPYFVSAFPMNEKQYVEATPDPQQRTAIAGYLMREGWCVFENQLMRAIEDYGVDVIIDWLSNIDSGTEEA